jgi:hypothetical protein
VGADHGAAVEPNTCARPRVWRSVRLSPAA